MLFVLVFTEVLLIFTKTYRNNVQFSLFLRHIKSILLPIAPYLLTNLRLNGFAFTDFLLPIPVFLITN